MVAQLLNHWFQPLEDDLGHAQAAFAGLLRAGDLEFANFTAFTTRGALFDTCTQLTQMDTETAAAIGFAGKSASTHAEQAYLPYPTALANMLHSLALIARLRTADAPARSVLLGQLDQNQAWLAGRAADAPMNFSHLFDLVEAQRLDALGQPWAALQTFEQAMRAAQAHQRPWHHALITERAGQCAMRHGQEHAGRALLARAHDLYRHWGAPDTDAAGMLRLVESIHAALEALALPHAASSLGRVTVSIGVAALGPTADTRPETLLRLADEALYRAKAQGRNRTVLGAPGTGGGAGAA